MVQEEEDIEEAPEPLDPPIVEDNEIIIKKPDVIVDPIVNGTVVLDDIPINEDAAEF